MTAILEEARTLPDFNAGFHDGYSGGRRKVNRSITYRRAFKKGQEARARQDNGGEDMPAPQTGRRR